MHLFHKWSPWVQSKHYFTYRFGNQTPFIGTIQTRICSVCGKMQQEDVD